MRGKFSGYRVISGAPDVDDLRTWTPLRTDDFDLTLDFFAGPAGETTSDAFTLRVCSPTRFLDEGGDLVISGAHTLIMRHFDGAALLKYLANRCADAEGETWEAVATHLHAVGSWEFSYRA